MNYEYNNVKKISPIKKINLTNQLLAFENQEINNNYYIFDNNSPYFTCYNNYNLENNKHNANQNQNNNYFYNGLNNPLIKRNIIKEEIKNSDYNDEIYKTNNYITKKYDKVILNLIEINNNKNNLNKNVLSDFIISQDNLNNNMNLFGKNQKINYSNSDKNLSPSIFHLTANPSNNDLFQINQNKLVSEKSNSKKNIFNYDKKQNHKKQIIKLKRGDSYKHFNIINQIDPIKNVQNNQENDNNNGFFDKKYYKNNHINLIPIPKNLKNKISSIVNNESKNKKNKNSKDKKKINNIDINIDYDEKNQRKINHQKISSLTLGNNQLNNNKNDLKNNKEFSESSNYLKRNRSEKNQKIKIKTNLQYNINDDDKKLKIKNKSPKLKNIKLYKNISINKNFKILWDGQSQAGKDSNGNIKINQDTFKVCENINNIKYFNLYILCDGHGYDGHHVSQFATEFIIQKVSNHPLIYPLNELNDIYEKLIEFNYKIINNIFSETDQYLSTQKMFDTYTSGTTCVLILQIGTKIICANIGDSRAILIYSTNEFNNTKIFPLSFDSKPDLPLEMKRIIDCGGEVHKGKNSKGNYTGPMRIFAKGKNYPGLAMSRSFGDFKSKEYGVICQPSFVEYNIDEYCKYIVLCSDGVWDFIDNENVMKIGNKHYLNNNPNGFCQEILGNASYWWEKEDIVIDDITALIVFFKF